MQPTYFTCTLGQAAELNLSDPSFKNINHFITSQAQSIPDRPAVGFASPASSKNEPWPSSVWTFSDVLKGTQATAKILDRAHGELLRKSTTVALICPSTPEFLFTWLALMRLGHSVLLIAPQCQPHAIAHLCKACQASVILYDDTYTSLCQEAADVARKTGQQLHPVLVPFSQDVSLADLLDSNIVQQDASNEVSATDIAYLHHTSGTSSGMPKPIPQSHHAGVGVLPSFAEGHDSATFTTTPLYHGGIADLFRAWASGALIWLFPGKGVPITARNVLKCLDAAVQGSKLRGLPPVKYFSSVPYVLQMMEADSQGLQHLRCMDIVGVGGAALPVEVGDRLVEKGVNLISRFGSAECGFLMSSHRDYKKDKEWQFLRTNGASKHLKFEKQDDDLAELVVTPGWPHMAKTNRSNGSYATADLFAPHESIPNAWRYDSRADSQLTLVTGKKFDPAPLEGAIATSDLLDDVLIFGRGKPFPGTLLFRSKASQHLSNSELQDEIWTFVDQLNSGSQDHARIPRKMMIVMPMLEKPLAKSSKGTIMRGVAEIRFAGIIDEAYGNMNTLSHHADVTDEDLPRVLKDIIKSIVPTRGRLDDDTELFSYGVDSIAGMQVRYSLGQLLPSATKQLPLNVVEDCGTVARLAKYLTQLRHGQETDDDEEDEHQFMLELVDQYSNFEQRSSQPLANGDIPTAEATTRDTDTQRDNDKDVIVLTGATGALGAHLLALYRDMDSVRKIFCLVRGSDRQSPRERVSRALEQRGLPGLPTNDPKVEVLQAALGEQGLGLSEEDYARISTEVSIVLHVAWSVNFRMRLRSFAKDNISSVTNLINMALRTSRSSPAKFAFCSSIASVIAYNGNKSTIPEEIIDDPAASSTLGYSRSKWVAEQVCARAGEMTPLRGHIGVFRVGQLAGDSCRGVWNTKEAWPMMLSSVKLTRTLPALAKETLNWLPVDIAATALTQGIDGVGGSGERVDVLHVLNDNREPKWTDLLGWLKKEKTFDTVSPAEWVARLQDAQEKDGADHPAFKLLDLWKQAYTDDDRDMNHGAGVEEPRAKAPDLLKTKSLIPLLRDIKPLDEQYCLRLWHWIDAHM